jgi:hypothetical protein
VGNSAGFRGGDCQSLGDMLAPYPLPFGSSVSTCFRWVNVTTVSFPSCAYPYLSLLAASLSQAPCLSAFIPASRIEDQSLPWGMCFSPSPRAVGIPPTLGSSSQVLAGDPSGTQGQSPEHFVCTVSGQRIAPPCHCSWSSPSIPVKVRQQTQRFGGVGAQALGLRYLLAVCLALVSSVSCESVVVRSH